MLQWRCEEQNKNFRSVCSSHLLDWQPGCCWVCDLVPRGFRDAAGVRAIADHDYYYPERADEHDENHNCQEQHILNAKFEWQRHEEIPLNIQPSSGRPGRQLTRREM
jgi:hypothetical protein